jgi:CBS domain-containing protein
MNVDRNLSRKAIDLAERNFVVLGESTNVAEAAKEMRKNSVMSVLVSSPKKSFVGIVTEKDILYRVVAENRGPFKTVLGEIMSTPLITIDGEASVKEAIELMRTKNIRRLHVTKNGEVIGVLTLRSIIGNSLDQAVELAEVELPVDSALSGVTCPYCQSRFKDKEELSKHIDRLHLGSGLLEGDLRQW